MIFLSSRLPVNHAARRRRAAKPAIRPSAIRSAGEPSSSSPAVRHPHPPPSPGSLPPPPPLPPLPDGPPLLELLPPPAPEALLLEVLAISFLQSWAQPS